MIHSDKLRYLTIQLDNCSKNFLFNFIEKYPRIFSLNISTYHSWSKLIQLSTQISRSSIRSLIVYEAFLDFNQYEYLHQLFKQLEILSVAVTSVEDAYRFLTLLFIGSQRKALEKLRSLTIKCDFNEPDTIAHWIRMNILRKLSYKCTTNLLTIWL
jgi:predicted HTH transcriptional regulator